MKNSQIKVLVVEDEVLLLKNIKKKITAAACDFCIVGDAFNGKEALELIEKLHPDVVFTDIRMPVMDGLELIKIINEEYPDIYTVIVSGYDDFEYARTALRYRAYNYLLKPLKAEALDGLLVPLREDILKKRRLSSALFFTKLLNGKMDFSADTDCPEKFKDAFFSCFFVCLGNLLTHCPANAGKYLIPEPTEDFIRSAVLRAAPSAAPDFWVIPQQFGNMYLVLLESSQNSSPRDEAVVMQRALLTSFPQVSVTIACGAEPVGPGQLHSLRVSLRKLLFSSLRIGQSCVLVLGEQTAPLPPAILTEAEVQYMLSMIRSHNANGFFQTVQQMFCEWEKQCYPQQWIEKILMQMFTVIQQCLFFSEEDYEQMQSTVFFNLETGKTLTGSADSVISEFVYWIILDKAVPTEIEATIEEMYTYICRHYKEAINISMLAQKYHFNHSYLTRVFKKEKGQSPLKLINELRIHDAEKLLTDSPLSIREISEMLGFTDQHYFSRIFKEFTGQNPKEYRLQK